MSAVALWAPARAIRLDFTEEEIRCARTVGVDLVGDPNPGSSDYVKRLAWLADLVVYGVVDKLCSEPHGSHVTQVRIKVVSIKKGQLGAGRLTVALVSGPQYSATLDRILEGRFDNEPSFAKGEAVLLFLTKGRIGAEDSEPAFSPPDRFYRLVDYSKFLVDGVTATLQGWGTGEYNVVRSDYEIRQVVAAQATNCR